MDNATLQTLLSDPEQLEKQSGISIRGKSKISKRGNRHIESSPKN